MCAKTFRMLRHKFLILQIRPGVQSSCHRHSKSTLLHLIGGVDRPTSGKIIIDGEDIYKLNETNLGEAIVHNNVVGCTMVFNDELLNKR